MISLAFAGKVQLIPDGTILIHIGMILLMIWILNRTFFKPIQQVIESREGKKGGSRGPAAEILDQVAEKKASYESEIRKTRLEGYQLIEKERASAIVEKHETVSSARTAVAEKLAIENSELDRSAKIAREEIEKEAEALAERITATVLK